MAFPSDSVRVKNWGSEILTDSDLESELDLLHAYLQAALNSTTGHTHDGTSNKGPKIPVTNLTVPSQATGDLIYASSSTAFARRAIGTATQLLHGGTTPTYSAIVAADLPAGAGLQYVTAKSSAVTSGTGIYTIDDNIPANTSGNILSALNLTITPSNSSNILEFKGVIYMANNTTAVDQLVIALHQDSVANALDLCVTGKTANDKLQAVPFYFTIAAGATAATTYKFYYGGNSASTTTVNGITGSRIGGGVLYSVATVKELKA